MERQALPLHNPNALRRSERAQGVLEFALTLPVLLLLMLGIFEFGRLLFIYTSVVTAAREAARYGAASGEVRLGVAYYQDCDGIRETAIRIGGIAGLSNDSASVDIQYDNGPGVDNITAGCPVGGVGPGLTKGDRIVVRTVATFNPTQGLISALPNVQVRSTARRTILVGIPIR